MSLQAKKLYGYCIVDIEERIKEMKRPDLFSDNTYVNFINAP